MKTTTLHKSHKISENNMPVIFVPITNQEFKENNDQMTGLLQSEHVIFPLKNIFEEMG